MPSHYRHRVRVGRRDARLIEQLDYPVRSHSGFAIRAMQELRRAERYRHYLSLVLFRFASRPDPDPARNDRTGAERPFGQLREIVRGEMRTSDLVSGIENGMFGALLIEANAEGVELFIGRIQEHLTEQGIGVETVSFPASSTGTESLAGLLTRSFPTPGLD